MARRAPNPAHPSLQAILTFRLNIFTLFTITYHFYPFICPFGCSSAYCLNSRQAEPADRKEDTFSFMHLSSPGLLYLHLYLLYLHGYLYYIPRNRPGLHSDLYLSWKDDSYTLIFSYLLTILIIGKETIIIRIQYPTFLCIFNCKIYCPPSHPRAGRL